MNPWLLTIARTDNASIRIRRYYLTALMPQSFAVLVLLLHQRPMRIRTAVEYGGDARCEIS